MFDHFHRQSYQVYNGCILAVQMSSVAKLFFVQLIHQSINLYYLVQFHATPSIWTVINLSHTLEMTQDKHWWCNTPIWFCILKAVLGIELAILLRAMLPFETPHGQLSLPWTDKYLIRRFIMWQNKVKELNMKIRWIYNSFWRKQVNYVINVRWDLIAQCRLNLRNWAEAFINNEWTVRSM